jgi:hypothetical protein
MDSYLSTQEEVDQNCKLRMETMQRGLKKVNRFYNQETLATGEMLKTAINEILESKGMATLFTIAVTDMEVLNV